MSINRDIANVIVANKPNVKNLLNEKGQLIVKLHKSIYGLRQAPVNFYNYMRDLLISIGFEACESDSCIFSMRSGENVTNIAIHVDDLLISSNSQEHIALLKSKFKETFGELDWNVREFTYLGMHLYREDDHSITVDMVAYTLDLLRRFADEVQAAPSHTKGPSDLALFTNLGEESIEGDSSKFKSATMALMYLANLRIDILKEVIILSMMAARPGKRAWTLLRRVLKYLKSHPSYCSSLGADSPDICVYTDAGYAEHLDGRSHTGIYLTLGPNGGPILVKSKKQSLVTQSSTEAEMLALTDSVKRALPVARLLAELGFTKTACITVMQDNTSTMHLAKVGEGMAGKAKHFRVRYHFLKELADEGLLKLQYCNTKDMIADVLTKPMVGKERMRQVVRMMYGGKADLFAARNAKALARVCENNKSRGGV